MLNDEKLVAIGKSDVSCAGHKVLESLTHGYQ